MSAALSTPSPGANLTEYAMNLNMELGLLVKGGDAPRDLDAHLRVPIQDRVVLLVINKEAK